MARSAPPSDDGSPARLIATMVGIVGILLLGSLAWSAVGALVSAVGAAGSALTTAHAAPPTLAPVVAVTPTVAPTDVPQLATPVPSATPAPTDVPTPTLAPTVAATPTVVASGRNPWILLPQPEPGTKVTPGQVVVEARGRGDAPIKEMRLELDGAALPVALEQRSDSTWRGAANTRVTAGQHNVRASVTDAAGRSGSYRWSFTASAAPAP
ncbi:MAG TPA: hypothetical protein VGJ60_37250 [Chloroflexota bacterium]